MSAGHGTHGLFIPGTSPLHEMRPDDKLVAAIAFIFAIVAAPREAFWVYAVFAAIILALTIVARIPVLVLARRLVVELPFLAFAFFLPIIGRGERVDVLGMSLSINGLWGAWNILAKATLGIAIASLLVATTPIASLLHALDRLHMPRIITAIAGFMVRYLDVVGGEIRRMTVARQSRAHDPRWFWQARAVASTAGVLFIRSFERGERVHLAMLSRGYNGALPTLDEPSRTHGARFGYALALPIVAWLITIAAWTIR